VAAQNPQAAPPHSQSAPSSGNPRPPGQAPGSPTARAVTGGEGGGEGGGHKTLLYSIQETDSEVTVKVSLQRDSMQGVNLQILRTSLRYRGPQRTPLALTGKVEVPRRGAALASARLCADS
jgi:hypothetical protein